MANKIKYKNAAKRLVYMDGADLLLIQRSGASVTQIFQLGLETWKKNPNITGIAPARLSSVEEERIAKEAINNEIVDTISNIHIESENPISNNTTSNN